MQLIDIQLRDAYALYEVSLKDLKKLSKACQCVELQIDQTVPDEVEAGKYFTEVFFPQLKTTLQEIEKQYGSTFNKKTS